jgi:beta-glucosidase/6-phospho-beta-glucosidase/beta-galactosidase
VWNLRWFADPIFFGDYPALMKESCGSRLPEFTDAQRQMLRGSADFLGLNHYTTTLAMLQPIPRDFDVRDDFWNDVHMNGQPDPTWPKACNTWLFKVPWSFRKILNW